VHRGLALAVPAPRQAKPGCLIACHAHTPQAMDYAEAKEMVRELEQHPGLVAQIVPSPVTLPYDATIQHVIKYVHIFSVCLRFGAWLGWRCRAGTSA
jgi:hypothetical protein